MSTSIQLLIDGHVCPFWHCCVTGTKRVAGLPSVSGHGRANITGMPSGPSVKQSAAREIGVRFVFGYGCCVEYQSTVKSVPLSVCLRCATTCHVASLSCVTRRSIVVDVDDCASCVHHNVPS